MLPILFTVTTQSDMVLTLPNRVFPPTKFLHNPLTLLGFLCAISIIDSVHLSIFDIMVVYQFLIVFAYSFLI